MVGHARFLWPARHRSFSGPGPPGQNPKGPNPQALALAAAGPAGPVPGAAPPSGPWAQLSCAWAFGLAATPPRRGPAVLRRRVTPAPLGSNPRGSRGHRAAPYPAGVRTARALRQRAGGACTVWMWLGSPKWTWLGLQGSGLSAPPARAAGPGRGGPAAHRVMEEYVPLVED